MNQHALKFHPKKLISLYSLLKRNADLETWNSNAQCLLSAWNWRKILPIRTRKFINQTLYQWVIKDDRIDARESLKPPSSEKLPNPSESIRQARFSSFPLPRSVHAKTYYRVCRWEPPFDVFGTLHKYASRAPREKRKRKSATRGDSIELISLGVWIT